MKNLYLILIILFTLLSCSNKTDNKNRASINDSISSIKSGLEDTVYHRNDSAIVPKNIYLYLDSIKIGATYTNNEGVYGYYRLLFTSSEETRSFYVEKIQIVGDGIVKLEKRFRIPSKTFGLDYDSPTINLVKWLTPEIIEINVAGKTVKLDINKIKLVDIQ